MRALHEQHAVLSNSAAVTAAAASSVASGVWRTYLTPQQLRCIDLLTYQLGHYPPNKLAAAATASHTTTPHRPSQESCPHPDVQRRRCRLDELSRSAGGVVRVTAATVAGLVPAGGSQHRHGDLVRTHTMPVVCMKDIRPRTALAEIRRYAGGDSADTYTSSSGGMHAKKDDASAGNKMDEEEDRAGSHDSDDTNVCLRAAEEKHSTHPHSLFLDEEAILHRFGMGGFASPDVKGFTGYFRQRWEDFHVTEMFLSDVRTTRHVDSAPVCSGREGEKSSQQSDEEQEEDGGAFSSDEQLRAPRPLSRLFSFSIPPPPPHTLLGHGCALEETGHYMEEGRTKTGQVSSTHMPVDCLLSGDKIRERECDATRSSSSSTSKAHGDGMARSGPTSMDDDDTAYRAEVNSVMHERNDESTTTAASLFEVNVPARLAALCAAPTHIVPTTTTTTTTAEAAPSTLVSNSSSAVCSLLSSSSSTTFPTKIRRGYYLHATLHKQHLAHSHAMSAVAQTLRIHPRAITVAGMKDYIGDTVQRVSLHNVSPVAVCRANAAWRRKGSPLCLSNFAYEPTPLSPGDNFGNAFRIVLRGVTASRACVQEALHAFAERGFVNYYGCQRFSWFGGCRHDAAVALLRGDWVRFAFCFLNYSAEDLTLRALLQRERKYPHPVQDQYRRLVVRGLRRAGIEPSDLDEAPFLRCPDEVMRHVKTGIDAAHSRLRRRSSSNTSSSSASHDTLTGARDAAAYDQSNPEGVSGVLSAYHHLHSEAHLTRRQRCVIAQLQQAYWSLDAAGRRLTAQRWSSYLWNQALTLRVHHLGAHDVMVGDWVTSSSLRRRAESREDRRDCRRYAVRVIRTAEEARGCDIADVLHPGFSLDGSALPRNSVARWYRDICAKYSLDWGGEEEEEEEDDDDDDAHSRFHRSERGVTGYRESNYRERRDFRESPRPIVRHPIHLRHAYDDSQGILTVSFALERGCYANVAISELMKCARCAGAESVLCTPTHAALWYTLGARDPGYVTSTQDIYRGYENGRGFVSDVAEVPPSTDSQRPLWEECGPDTELFIPAHQEPYRVAHRWGKQHLLRNMQRRIQSLERSKAQLLEQPLARQMTEEEVSRYAGGHTVPLPPNGYGRRVSRALRRRRRRYAGAPKEEVWVRRAVVPCHPRGMRTRGKGGSRDAPPPFSTIDRNTWNVTW